MLLYTTHTPPLSALPAGWLRRANARSTWLVGDLFLYVKKKVAATARDRPSSNADDSLPG